jgi:hypothetical protein
LIVIFEKPLTVISIQNSKIISSQFIEKSPFLSNFDKKGLLANQRILMDFPLKCELQSSKDSATD